MPRTRELSKNRELALRARTMARILSGRVYSDSSGVYLVRGKPAFERLIECLHSIDASPARGNEPGPNQLGFSVGQIHMVTEPLLADLGRALQKWRKVIRGKDQRKTRTAADATELREWKRETASLGASLESLHALQRNRPATESLTSPYRPTDSTLNVESQLNLAFRGKRVHPAWEWYGFVVAWIGGQSGLRRYLEAISPHLLYPATHALATSATTMRALTVEWLPGQQSGETPARAQSIRDGLTGEMIHHCDVLGLGVPAHSRDVFDCVRAIRRKCDTVLESLGKRPSRKQVASVAALCAFDGAGAPIPTILLDADVNVAPLANLSEADGYESLLRILGNLHSIWGSFDDVRRLALAGATAEDIDWLEQYDRRRQSVTKLAQNSISPSALRLLVNRFGVLGVECFHKEIEHALRLVGESGDSKIVKAFLAWMEGLPSESHQDSRILRGFWLTFLDALNLASFGSRLNDLVRRWTVTRPRQTSFSEIAGTDLSPEVNRQLNTLAYFQTLAGQEIRLTKSIRKLFDRLAAEKKLLRQMKEVCAHTALTGLRQMLVTETEKLWNEFTLRASLCETRPSEKLEILRWARQLDKRQAAHLKELLQAWNDRGEDYREHLGPNIAWLNQAAAQGILTEEWLQPDDVTLLIQDKSATIGIARNPFDIFLMGSYFDTCLELGEGFNSETVICNAYEANKAVLYVRDSDRKVLARKLIAINADNSLVGWRTYVSGDSDLRAEIKKRVDRYCEALAKRCGVSLSNSGLPQQLTEQFWYDDGLESWHSSVRESLHSAGASSKLCPTLELHWSSFVDELDRLDLWPPPEGDTPPSLLDKAPALCEEVMAQVAIRLEEPPLARTLRHFAITESGKIEAFRALSRFEPDAAIPELPDYDRPEYYRTRNRLGAILAEIDHESAVLALARLALQDGYTSTLNVLGQICRSPAASAVLQRWLSVERRWGCFDDEMQILLFLLEQHAGRQLDDAFLARILFHHYDDEVEASEDTRYVLELAQWMPRFRNSSRAMSTRWLQQGWDSIYNDGTWGIYPGLKGKERLGVIIACMKNPCSGTRAFLKRHAGEHPAALLALAIMDPGRFAAHLETCYRANPQHMASMLAILAMKGRDAGREFLLHFHTAFPEQQAMIDQALTLHAAIDCLDWHTMAKIQSFQSTDLTYCLPYLVWKLWSRFDASEEDLDIGAIDSKSAVEAMSAFSLNLFGLGLELTKRLRSCREDRISYLQRAIHALFDHVFWCTFPGELRLWMDRISGYRLYTDESPETMKGPLVFIHAKNWTGVNDFLFDGAGNRRPASRLAWNNDDEVPGMFPADLDRARQFMELLKEKAIGRGPVKAFSLSPVTEVQRRLLSSLAD